MCDINEEDRKLQNAIIENAYSTMAIYKQKEKEYRIAANSKGFYSTCDKERYTSEANKYKKQIEELYNIIFNTKK